MSPIEAAATLFGLINVTLVVRRSMWNYPFALAMVTLYAWIFFHQKLYSDALLQLFYIVVNLYGWWNWARSRAESGEVRVEQLSGGARLAWVGTCVVATAAWGALMHRYTDAQYPWWDGGIAVFSVAAQILQSRRNWESWVLWILVDVAAIPLFVSKGLWLTAGLYLVFLALSVWGLIHWIKAKA
ncbi:nicotinamide riboside transporter PnuC [Sphingomonas psychrotolerans]|uniref:Nicotinamide riboside transporter PnuC n=1 Tax=Sphingomonas psychrotolerans TaxID=1327635 RepID=A0ABU3N1M6_9SPHN|nr:nicotinamide riboside transporter PnuC [Sphingomonas psychrotolerans]MDT8757130.1 nicotinamide riboside transporter PnuC [Sphingomonas psychrotolerans]